VDHVGGRVTLGWVWRICWTCSDGRRLMIWCCTDALRGATTATRMLRYRRSWAMKRKSNQGGAKRGRERREAEGEGSCPALGLCLAPPARDSLGILSALIPLDLLALFLGNPLKIASGGAEGQAQLPVKEPALEPDPRCRRAGLA
jgi:hypothetical protein